jgi:hypothetical protein
MTGTSLFLVMGLDVLVERGSIFISLEMDENRAKVRTDHKKLAMSTYPSLGNESSTVH